MILRASIQAKIDEASPALEEDDPFAGDDFFESTDSAESVTAKFKDPSEYGISVWTHPMNLTTAQTAKQGGQVRKLASSIYINHKNVIVIFILLDCGNVYFCRLQICEWLSHSSNPCLLSLHLVSSPHPLSCS